MLKVLKENNLNSAAVFILFAALLHLVGFLAPIDTFSEGLGKEDVVRNLLHLQNPNALFAISFVFNLGISFVLYQVNNKFGLFENTGFLIPYSYTLFASSSTFLLVFGVYHILLLIKLIALFLLLSFYDMPNHKIPVNLYVLGFLTGVLMLLTPINFIYFIVFAIGLLFFKPSRWKDLFILLLGLFILLFFIGSVLFLMGYETSIKDYLSLRFAFPGLESFIPFQPFYLFLGVLGISIAYGFSSFWRNSIFIRNTHQFLLALLIVSTIISLFNGYRILEDHWHFAIPFALYLGNLLGYSKRKWIPEVLHGLILIVVLFFQYDYLLPISFEELPKFLFLTGVMD